MYSYWVDVLKSRKLIPIILICTYSVFTTDFPRWKSSGDRIGLRCWFLRATSWRCIAVSWPSRLVLVQQDMSEHHVESSFHLDYSAERAYVWGKPRVWTQCLPAASYLFWALSWARIVGLVRSPEKLFRVWPLPPRRRDLISRKKGATTLPIFATRQQCILAWRVGKPSKH